MNESDMRHVLAETLDDFRVTRSEKKALSPLIAEWKQAGRTALAQSTAFKLATEQLIDPGSKSVLQWLEALVKLLHHSDQSQASAESNSLFSPDDDCSGRIQSHCKAARTSIDICVFTITDNRITEQILSAHRRGVQIRIISDNDKADDLGSDIDHLDQAGVAVRRDQTEYHMHHKFAIFDNRILLNGSYNWTVSASRDNEENLVITDDRQLIRQFKSEFERLWEKFG